MDETRGVVPQSEHGGNRRVQVNAARVDGQLRIRWRFIRIADAGERADLAAPRPRVKALRIAPFASAIGVET